MFCQKQFNIKVTTNVLLKNILYIFQLYFTFLSKNENSLGEEKWYTLD